MLLGDKNLCGLKLVGEKQIPLILLLIVHLTVYTV